MARRRASRIAIGIVLALVCVEAALSGALYLAMRQPPDAFGRVMKHVPMPMMLVLPFESLWNRARGGKLQPGDMAPDFRLPTHDHRETVQLSSFRGSRPVVLVFGSYT
jgi:hypothetical protein